MSEVDDERGSKGFLFWLKVLGSSSLVLSGLSAIVFAAGERHGGGRYVVFDAPNTNYTYPVGINDSGETTGFLIDALGVRGFVREQNGKIDVFDGNSEPVGINNRGEVVGSGFLRNREGRITPFSVPGALPEQTFASGLNDRGSITGKFVDDVLPREHGYVRDQIGRYAKFDIPNSSYLIVAGINARGDVSGTFDDWNQSGKQRMFVRDQAGHFKILDVPNGVPWVTGINDRGDLAGIYVVPGVPQNEVFGFFLDHSGTLTELDVPSPGVTGLNNRGEVVGIFGDPERNLKTCGFIWRRQGATTVLDFPDGTATYAYGINDRGQVIGAFDVAGLGSRRRGFLYTEP